MPAFPRHSIAWKFEERTLVQRVTQALPSYGLAIGVIARMYRWAVLNWLVPDGWGAILATIAVGVILMCGLATAHFANFSVRSWRWRAPALGGFIALGESATSLTLILLHQERGGRALLTIGDWPSAVLSIAYTRVGAICLFALVLAGVVSALRNQVTGVEAGSGGEGTE